MIFIYMLIGFAVGLALGLFVMGLVKIGDDKYDTRADRAWSDGTDD